MRRYIFLAIIILIIAGCDAYEAAYVDMMAAALPDNTGGRTLHIPTLDVHADVTLFPIGETTWDIDPWEADAGQLEHLGWIDFVSNTVIAAHSEYPSGAPGLFSDLHTLNIGDVIFVRDDDLERAYIVREIKTVDYRDLSVVYPTTHYRLTLITCSIPSYVTTQGLYYERVVVIADGVD